MEDDRWEDRLEGYLKALAEEEPPSHWPPGVKRLSNEGFRRLGFDNEGRIYWDGKAIEISQRLQFSRLQRRFAIVVGVFTILGGLGSVMNGLGSGLNNGFELGCKQGWWIQKCNYNQTSSGKARAGSGSE